MNTQFKNMLVLLGNSIHPCFLQELEEPDWADIMKQASYHRILPLVTEAALRYDSFKSFPEKDFYIQESVKSAVEQYKKTADFCRVYKEFSKENIFPVVVKGIICRSLYGELGEHRTSGDEDILVEEKDFKKIDEILRSLGYLPDERYYTEDIGNAVFEIPYTSLNGDFRIEVHFTPLGRNSEMFVNMNSYFSSVFTEFREEVANSTVFRTLNHTEHFLFLIFHALKHFIFSGVGIRQILDILLYAEKYGDEIDYEYIKTVLENFNALSFFGDIIAVGNEYLGFALDFDCIPRFKELLLKDIADSGIYGKGSPSRKTASKIVSAALEDGGKMVKYGKTGLLLNTVFPSKSHFKSSNTKAETGFLPGAYIARIASFIKKTDEYKNGAVKEGLEISRQRLKLLEKYKLL